ncbi:MAG: DUF58 domain-containing protein [Pseudomonadales bacterium]
MRATGKSKLDIPGGAFTKLEDLLALRHSAASLVRKSPPTAGSQLAGNYRTRQRGRGLDFAEVRPYQAGDDIRSIDWRVTARSSKPHTRLYTEEKERPVLVLCDQRASMFFGSQIRFKSVQAANIASLLAWSALHHGDRVGGLVLSNDGHTECRPKASSKQVLRLISDIQQANSKLSSSSDNPVSLLMMLHELRRIARPGCAVYLISDFADFDEDCVAPLFQVSRHCEVNALCIYDPLEKALPAKGRFQVAQGSRRAQVNAANTTSRDRYKNWFEQHQQQVEQLLSGLGISLQMVATNDDPRLLQFGRRIRSKARA